MITDAMGLMSLSRPTINRFIYRGEIPNFKVGKRRLFDREELIVWVKRHRDDKPKKSAREKSKKEAGSRTMVREDSEK